MGKIYHIPVMQKEAIEWLSPKEDGTYIDCTLGGGGHSRKIAENIGENGRLLSIDVDQDAIDYVRSGDRTGIKCEWILEKGNFKNLRDIAQKSKIKAADGIFFDLGVSSHQLDEKARGFSFKGKNTLDMRMNKELTVSAKELVNGLYEKELVKLLTVYGEEPFAKRIARKIVEERKVAPIENTEQLYEVIQKVVPVGVWQKAGMRVFQALRIAVNDELGVLRAALPQALDLLQSNGRLVVISFHSLEDRIVKVFMKESEEKGIGKRCTKDIIRPSKREVLRNNRARSAKMRVFEKI